MYKYLNILFFTIYLILNPKLIYLWIFKGLYIPVLVQYLWLRKYEINTIIDVGANEGKVSQALNYLFPEAKIYAFEPNRDLHSKINARVNSKNIVIEDLAIADKAGHAILFKSENSALSSLMQTIYNSKTTEYHVTTNTLDNYFKHTKLKLPIFLKVDTEGAEGLVLKGATNFLTQVSLIHVETYYNQRFKNQLLFDNIYELLQSLGFKFVGEAQEAYFYPKFSLSDNSTNSIFINKKYL